MFRKFMLFLCLLVLRYGGKKKRPLPQYLVCDKSLKRTHDIGHFAVMTLPCSRFPDHKTENGPLLPFIECIKTENRGKVKANAEIFPASYPGRGSPPSMIGRLLWSIMALPWPCGSTCSSFKKSMICSGSKNRALYALLFAAFSAKNGTSRSGLCYTVSRLHPLRAAEKPKIQPVFAATAGSCGKKPWSPPVTAEYSPFSLFSDTP
ncbi:MAG: hypothetical protein ACLR7P_09125 [Faecalibacterium sp.]